MALAHILAIYVKPRMQPSDTGLQALLADFHRQSGSISGPAPTAATPQKSDGLAQMIRREVLAAQARHARNLRQCARAASLENECRSITLQLLRGPNAKA